MTSLARMNPPAASNLTWYNIEDNSDLNTSNESYMSSSSSDLEEDVDVPSQRDLNGNSFAGSMMSLQGAKPPNNMRMMRKFSRGDQAIAARRFESYFTKLKIEPEDYFKTERRMYDRKNWIKLCFDGMIKRFNIAPKKIQELYEVASSRFSVLKHILESGQFKPLVTYKSPKMAMQVLLETDNDL